MRRFLGSLALVTSLLFVLAPVPASDLPVGLVSSTYAYSQSQDNSAVKVWVNTRSGVYHCPGTRWYGATKNGEYMAQGEARQKGYRPAYGRPCESTGTESPTPSRSKKIEPSASKSTHQGNPDVKVWVNTASGVYHCPGTRWYGRTKAGEYLTQAQAQDKGFRPAYGKVCQ